jgi:hypothetical protein
MEAPVTSWTAQAAALADAIREPGFRAAEVTASAWRAGVHPQATNGLVGAALALAGGDAQGSLWAQVAPCPRDTDLLEQGAELDGAVAEFGVYAVRLRDTCRDALEDAAERAAAARARTTADDPGIRAAALAALERARAEMADCEAALEILGDKNGGVLGCLDYALTCLRRLPGDFTEHYETPKAHIRQHGPLPAGGDFLTGLVWEAA